MEILVGILFVEQYAYFHNKRLQTSVMYSSMQKLQHEIPITKTIKKVAISISMTSKTVPCLLVEITGTVFYYNILL